VYLGIVEKSRKLRRISGLVNARKSAIFVIQYIMYEQQERFFS